MRHFIMLSLLLLTVNVIQAQEDNTRLNKWAIGGNVGYANQNTDNQKTNNLFVSPYLGLAEKEAKFTRVNNYNNVIS